MATLAGILSGRGSAPALMCCQGGPIISRAQLQAAVTKLATELTAVGIRPGDSVSIADENTVEFIVAFLAVVLCRGLAAPLNPAYRTEEFNFYLEDSKSKLMILPAKPCPQAEASAAAMKVPIARLAVHATPRGVEPKLTHSLPVGQPSSVTPVASDPALLLHTSGTTGRPKAVPLTHGNLQASLVNIIGTYEMVPSDRSYLVMPLFHVHGLMCGLLSPLAAQAAVILPKANKFSATTFWQDAVEHQATFYTAVPTMHQVLLARASKEYPSSNPPPLRFIRSCSSSLAPATLHQLEATFKVPVLEAYAMTEASHQMTSNPLPKHGPHKPGTVGRAQGSLQVAILDLSNKILPTGKIGEVCIRGPNVTSGYLNNPKANEEAFAGGWFHTGDQGFLDAEGFLTLTGRIKELINKGGEKISPLEVDAALLAHPHVAEAVCFGAPDEKYGETVEAAIVLKPNAPGSEAEIKESIKAAVRERLAAFKIPTHIFITKTLPKTATGKIQRRKMVEHFMSSPKPAAPTPAPQGSGSVTGHQVVARALRSMGVTHAFGVIGIPVTPLASAFHEVGIRFLSFRNEQAAGYAAAAAGYLTRVPAAFLTVSGPGFINGIAGLGHAAVNGMPLIMISGSSESSMTGAGAFQECDQLALAHPHCKAIARMQCLRSVGGTIAELVKASVTGRPGPVYLDAPSDVLNSTIDAAQLAPKPAADAPAPRPPSASALQSAVAALQSAQRPLIVVGHGAIFSGATESIRKFAKGAGIPVLGTPMARGVLPDEHPLSATAARTLVLAQCDVALIVGAPLNWQLHHGQPPKWSETVKFVVVDEAVSAYDAKLAHVAVEGDIVSSIQALAGGVRPASAVKAWSSIVAESGRKSVAKLESKLHHDAFPLDFYTALRVIRDGIAATPQRDRIIVTSEGANTMDMARLLLKAYSAPTRIDAGVWGTMGVGLPGAIAAAAVQPPSGPRTPVVALEGDSALGFTMAELETICRYKLPVVVVVFNNEGIYGGDRRTEEQQRAANAGLAASHLEGDPAPTALTPGARHDMVFRAFGGEAWAVKDARQLASAFVEALKSGKPCLIDIAIDPMAGRESGSVHDFNHPASKL